MTAETAPAGPAGPAEFFAAVAELQVPATAGGPAAFTFDVRAFVVRRGGEIALVDTLMRPESIDLLENALAAAGAEVADISTVVLTHSHPDHTGCLAEISRRAPHVSILAGAGDVAAIAASTGVTPQPTTDGEIVVGLRVVGTPGHTLGHLCLFDEASSTMLLGDAAANHGGVVRSPAAFTADAHRYEQSLRLLSSLTFDTGLPAHGDPIRGDASGQLRRLVDSTPSG